MDSATWWRTPAAASAGRRLRSEVSKNSSTALSSNEGELARSTTTCAPARASLRPWPVMVLTPVLGEAATTSWPPRRRMATVLEPIRPVPPMTTIFMADPPLSVTGAGIPQIASVPGFDGAPRRVVCLPDDPGGAAKAGVNSGRPPWGSARGPPAGSPALATRLDNLAGLYQATGRYAEA